MAWKKASQELGELLAEATGPFECQRKMMFGSPVYVLNGNMFTGVHQDNVFVRLSVEDRGALLAENDEAAPFEPMPGRAMKEYMVLPEAIINDPQELHRWLERSHRFAASLPLKQPKARAARRKKASA
jgi:TfoX/Sxy family transcriptional regulator of competence genes